MKIKNKEDNPKLNSFSKKTEMNKKSKKIKEGNKNDSRQSLVKPVERLAKQAKVETKNKVSKKKNRHQRLRAREQKIKLAAKVLKVNEAKQTTNKTSLSVLNNLVNAGKEKLDSNKSTENPLENKKKKKPKKDNLKDENKSTENPLENRKNKKPKKDNLKNENKSTENPLENKKKKKSKKKKTKKMVDETNASSNVHDDNQIKPSEENVKTNKTKLFVKNPQDYSANWDELKKVLDGKKRKNENNLPETNEVKKKQKESKKRKNVDENSINKKQKSETNEKKIEIWFDDVDPILLEDEVTVEDGSKETADDLTLPTTDSSGNTSELVKNKSYKGLTKLIAMDCEMVGIGFDGKDSAFARVSIVNHFGQVLLDKFAKPMEKVVDYRTEVSGVRPSDLEGASSFKEIQKEVAEILEGRILIGHALQNDLKCLFLSHPKKKIRDTSKFLPFKQLFGGRTPSLKKLSEKILNIKIQHGEHSSIQDAQAAMRIYTLHRKNWEKIIDSKKSKSKSAQSNTEKSKEQNVT